MNARGLDAIHKLQAKLEQEFEYVKVLAVILSRAAADMSMPRSAFRHS